MAPSPHRAPTDRITEEQGEQRGDGPHAGAADKVDDCQDAAADRFGRIFASVGECERLFGADSDAGDKPRCDEPPDGRRQCAQDRERAEQQKIELIDFLAAPAVAKFALASRANEHAEDRRAADQGGFGAGAELGLDHIRYQRAQHDHIDHIKEVSSGDERDNLDMQRCNFRIVERIADKAFNRLSHDAPPFD